MAFDRTKLGGNLNASSVHFSMFIYSSDTDDLATIAADDYFILANGNTLPAGMERGCEQIIFQDDFMLVSATDGFGIAKVKPNARDIEYLKTEV